MSRCASRILGAPAHVVRRLRHRLSVKVAAAIVGVAAAVLAVAGGLSLWLFVAAQMKSVAALGQLQADTAAAKIQQFVDDLESHLRRPIGPSWASTSDEDRWVDALRTLRALPALSTLRLLDPQGHEQLRVSRLGPDVAASGADFSGTEAYATARREGRHIGPIYFQEGSEPYVTIHVGSNTPVRGGVVADINLKLVSDIVMAMRIGETGRAFLVDSQGYLISHPDISLVLRHTDASSLPHVRAALERSPSARGTALVAGQDFSGRDILSASATLPTLHWTLVTELPRAEALAPVRSSVRLWLIVLLCGLAAAALCGVLISRTMIRPIETLTTSAIRIGSGDLEHRIAVSGADELAQLGRRFNEMAENLRSERATLEDKVLMRTQELARANQAKSRFLASASHDLRQPLHALSLFVDELRAQPTEVRRRRLHDNLAEAVGRLNSMFDAILDTSKIEAGAITPSLSHFPVAPLLDTLRAIFASAAEVKGLELRIDSSAAWVQSDPVLLQRILQNLVANAIRYTGAGCVGLDCCEADGQLILSVFDTGPGIPADLQSEIFCEFFRAPTPGQGGERGLGLGLFIVESFARLLDHPLDVRSTPGRGARFEIRVPRVSPLPEAASRSARSWTRPLSDCEP